MGLTKGLQIGKVIYDILKDDTNLMGIDGMSRFVIQPAPLKEQTSTDIAITYEIDACVPVNYKRESRIQTAPLYIVDFTLECISKDYSNSILLSAFASQALQEAPNGSYQSVKLNGITLESANEDYNKAKRFYVKRLSFQARILV